MYLLITLSVIVDGGVLHDFMLLLINITLAITVTGVLSVRTGHRLIDFNSAWQKTKTPPVLCVCFCQGDDAEMKPGHVIVLKPLFTDNKMSLK